MLTTTPTVPPLAVGDQPLTQDEALRRAANALSAWPGPYAHSAAAAFEAVLADHARAGRCRHRESHMPECPEAHLARHLLAVL